MSCREALLGSAACCHSDLCRSVIWLQISSLFLQRPPRLSCVAVRTSDAAPEVVAPLEHIHTHTHTTSAALSLALSHFFSPHCHKLSRSDKSIPPTPPPLARGWELTYCSFCSQCSSCITQIWCFYLVLTWLCCMSGKCVCVAHSLGFRLDKMSNILKGAKQLKNKNKRTIRY